MNRGRLRGAGAAARGLAVVLTAVALAAGDARAALVERDWKAANDRLITADTATGLEWLDLSVTIGLSYDAATLALAPGSALEGFRHATDVEVLGLWQSAGIPFINAGFDPANFGPVSALVAKVGLTWDLGTDQIARALAEDTSGLSTWPTFAELYRYEDAQTQTASTCWRCGYFAPDGSAATFGQWLVREGSAPEPGSVTLVALGLAGLGALRRRRR